MYVPTRDLHQQNAVLVLLMVATVVGVVLAATRAKAIDAIGATILIGVAGVWVRVDEPYEGRTILKVTSSNGLTAGDLLAFPGAAVAVILLIRLFLRGRRGRLPPTDPR